jgi:hypothetical protein
MRIRPVEAEFFHADKRTDMKLTVAFYNFANAPKNGQNAPRARNIDTALK